MKLLPSVLIALLLVACESVQAAAQDFATEHGPVRVVEVTSGLDHPWGVAFLPGGGMLVTERSGRLRQVGSDGRLSEPLGGVPEVLARGQGGLLDVTLDPRFAENSLVYLSYAEPGEGGAGTAVARGRLGEGRLDNVEVVFRQLPKVSGNNHWGSRLVFTREGHLFVTLGDRFNYSERAQDLSTHIGKIVRINPDGSVPRDNPFVGRSDARPEIWSLGHRNSQGAALHPTTGRFWMHEHGAKGGDEINVPEPGKNYGWPVISYGVHYSGAKIGEGTQKAGMEQPLYHWDPSIAPSGMAFYTGDAMPRWKGNLFIGALAGRALHRLELDGTRIVKEERMLQGLRERIRDVRQGPDGALYLLTDSSNGRLLRIEPASRG